MNEMLREQIRHVITRARYGSLTLDEAMNEVDDLLTAPEVSNDVLQDRLQRISLAYESGTLNTYSRGPWTGMPTGKAIEGLLNVDRREVRYMRDAWYRLVAGVPPFNPDVSPEDDEGDDPGPVG